MAFINPFAFRPLQVTFWTTVVYLALVIPLIVIQETVPRAPSESALPNGISLAEAWADLANLTEYFHPANSHANDDARAFLFGRVQQILDRNGASWTIEAGRTANHIASSPPSSLRNTDAVIFDDLLANVTFPTGFADGRRTALYYESTNLYVYIRGTKDEAGDWWRAPPTSDDKDDKKKPPEKRLVLVNAHFDSVSSGFGATDDGVGVVSGLQLVRYFSTPGHQPERGVVVLFNNAEEEFLLGAAAFAHGPLAPHIKTFVNLEGAGAGGRAILFRSTDLEVMEAYRAAPHPFGTVVFSDTFKLGLVRSDTDYRVWAPALGYRGIDVAFMKPRAYYHTRQDDRRHTSRDSIWHMLSGAVASARGLSGWVGDRVDRGKTEGVWFDLFGDSLVLFALRGLFAWSVTILVVSPLALGAVFYLLYRLDRDYMFRAKIALPDRAPEASHVPVGGWKGFFRFPVAFAVAGAAAFGVAFLLRKVNPFIIHSSLYTVLTLSVTLFYFVFWVIVRGANYVRPTAFHRAYSLLWLFLITWILLVIVTVTEDQGHAASGYFVVFWASSVFLSTLITLLEIFALQTKKEFVEELDYNHDVYTGEATNGGHHDENEALIAPSPGEVAANESAIQEDDEGEGAGVPNDNVPTETSPLIGGNTRSGRPTTFATGYRRSLSALLEQRRQVAAAEQDNEGGEEEPKAFGFEQAWSKNLPSWTWFIQFLLLAPFTIILVSQLLLTLAHAVQQTGTDGSNLLLPYIIIVLFTIFLLLPLTPFVHRVTRHIPLFFFFVFVGTLIYALAANPFSPASPYKFFVRQTFSVDHGNTSVILTGYERYVAKIIRDLPSAAGRPWSCAPTSGRQVGLVDCSFDGTGLEPRIEGANTPFSGSYAGLVSFNATRLGAKATLEINGVNTKSCALNFDRPVRDVSVRGGFGWDKRFDFDPTPPPEDGNWTIGDFVLWRRDWSTPWVVDISWDEEQKESQQSTSGLSGHVVCRWADANTPGTVPAVDEVWKYAPPWSIATIRQNPPLLQGSKRFSV